MFRGSFFLFPFKLFLLHAQSQKKYFFSLFTRPAVE
jgi:hypothetical protein